MQALKGTTESTAASSKQSQGSAAREFGLQSSFTNLALRWALRTVACFAILVLLSFVSARPAAAQAECTPSGWSGPVRCMPVWTTPWIYTDATGLPYARHVDGSYKSLESYMAEVRRLYSSFCVTNYTTPGPPTGTVPFYDQVSRQYWPLSSSR